MIEIVDLSQEIYEGMAVFDGLPEVKIKVHVTHEEWEGIAIGDGGTPAVNRLVMGEHTGTHVDAINHMGRQYRELRKSIVFVGSWALRITRIWSIYIG